MPYKRKETGDLFVVILYGKKMPFVSDYIYKFGSIFQRHKIYNLPTFFSPCFI